MEGYKRNHGEFLKKIPIGIEGNGLLVVVDNETGVIELEDFDRGTFEYIAGSIQELINNVRLIR